MECYASGYPGNIVLPLYIWDKGFLTIFQLFQRIIYDEAISDMHKNRITQIFSESDKRLVDGSDEHLSVLDMALRISGVLSGA